MKALANLAKYVGVYEEWNRLRRQHQLKWSSTNTLDVFERIMNNGTVPSKPFYIHDKKCYRTSYTRLNFGSEPRVNKQKDELLG
jgi:hypothetical protein